MKTFHSRLASVSRLIMLACASAVALGLTAVNRASAQEFEGVITMHAVRPGSNDRAAPPIELQYSTKKGDVRVELGAGTPNSMAGLILPREKKIIQLMAAQSLYSEQPLPELPALTPANAPKVVRTGKTESIAGYSCEHVLVSTATDTLDICLSKALGNFSAGAAALRMLGTRADGWPNALVSEGAFPLKVSQRGATVVEVTKVEKKFLSPGLFVVPDSYTKAPAGGGRRN